MKLIKDSVARLGEYFVLQDHSVIKLNQNESPYDVPPELKAEILNRLSEANWNRYCENRPTALIEAISSYTNFPAEGIVAGNGSNEIIQAIFSAICREGDSIVVVAPGFSVYPRLAQILEMNVISVPLAHDFSFDVDNIIAAGQDAKMVILPSPNNPTGTTLQIDEIIDIAENISGAFVLDEAYFEFHKHTAQDYLEQCENLMIIRTFSKAFSLAGLRLGYLLARPPIATEIEKAKLPFSVGIFQQIAGEILMKNSATILHQVAQIIQERDKLFAEVRNVPGIQAIASAANFFIFKIDGQVAKDAYDSFYQNGILLRHFSDERLKHYLRVTIGTPAENRLFLNTLKKITGNK